MDEAITGAVTLALTAAARIGEIRARQREQQARDAEAASAQAAREAQSRYAAEWAAARAQLAALDRPGWWEGASQDELASAYQHATEWADAQQEAAAARDRIAAEVKDRYGIDLQNPSAEQAGQDQRRDALIATAQAEALDATARADQARGRVLEHESAATGYDSAQRRHSDYEQMVASGVPKPTAEVAVTADTGQGKPARAAVSTTAAPGKARRQRGGQGQERARQGRTR